MNFTHPEGHEDLLLVRVGKALYFENADFFVDRCRKELDRATDRVLVVFEEGTIIDSAGMGAVIRVYRAVKQKEGGMFGLVSYSSHVEAVLGMTGFERLLEHYPTEEHALEAMHDAD